MRVSPLDLISTPIPVLNSLGLRVRVGLSSEDPMVVRHASEPYHAYLTIYSPEGMLLERTHLGEILPHRRRMFDISAITRKQVPGLDHLAVVHRVPSRLLSDVSSVEDEIELPEEPDYSMFRSLLEYSYPEGGNGSVIYETPPRLNAGTSGHKSSNTLTFTCQTVLSERVNTYVIIIHYSVNPSYSRIGTYEFALHSLSGDRVFSDSVDVGPFAVRVMDMAQMVPRDVVEAAKDPEDGLATFGFVGCSEDAAMMVMLVNAAPSLGAVAVEHTHPPQTYLLPLDVSYQRKAKTQAQSMWKSIFSADRTR